MLGDVIEAMVGAIYLDSDGNFELTKGIVHKLMKDKFMIEFSDKRYVNANP